MKRSIGLLSTAMTLLLFTCAASLAQNVSVQGFPGVSVNRNRVKAGTGAVIIPRSNQSKPGDAGVKVHTNFRVFRPNTWAPNEAPPFSGYAFETPASLGCLYRTVSWVAGCNPNTVTLNPFRGSKAIAIVDAYDDPWAGPDLAYFSAQFGLPFKASQLRVVYADGFEPAIDPTGGWELEESLDIEWAHAMSPKAQIYLVEASSNYLSDLLTAVGVASSLVQCGQTSCPSGGKGTGEVTMSWGGAEFSDEATLDSSFSTPGVVYFASSGDSPGVQYPCASPNVVCAGGTTVGRNPSTGDFLYELSWDEAGGGLSDFEPIPSYQSGISGIVGTQRGVPDISFDSNPNTGVWVWDSNYFEATGGGWFILGGTSVASPSLAGIVNSAGSFAASSAAELTTIYGSLGTGAFRDVMGGWCGPYSGYASVRGWDLCTGVGVDHGLTGK